jgi:hypothetical protein
MKLRIKGDSIRFRLLQPEVSQLATTGRVSDSIRFGSEPGNALTYTIISSMEVRGIAATFAGGEITIQVPAITVSEWAESDILTIATVKAVGETGYNVSVLIEKDLVCSSRPDDPDNKHAFTMPDKGKTV